ncbi:MAG: hypothetical protein WCF59_06185 [Desulfobaccales bacterium]
MDKKSGWKEEFRQAVFCWAFWTLITSASYSLLKLFKHWGANEKAIYLIFGFPVLILLWESVRLPLWIFFWVMVNRYESKGSLKKTKMGGILTTI